MSLNIWFLLTVLTAPITPPTLSLVIDVISFPLTVSELLLPITFIVVKLVSVFFAITGAIAKLLLFKFIK